MSSALQDRRRVLGPPDGKRILPLPRQEDVPTIKTKNKNKKTQKIFLKTGVVVNASGSAYLETDDTKVQCAVYGPKPIRGSFIETADVTVEVRFSPYCELAEKHDSVGSKNNDLSKEVASFIESSVLHAVMAELYPKSSITVVISFISIASADIKSSIAAAVNAVGLALTDSGISLRDIVTASSVNISETTSSASSGVVCFALTQEDAIVGSWIDSDGLQLNDLNHIIDECKQGATEVRQLINGAIIEEYKSREKQINEVI